MLILIDIAAAMDDFESTPKAAKSKPKPMPKASGSRSSQYAYDPSSSSTQALPTRPPPRPLGNANGNSGQKKSNGGVSGSGGFLTQAERGRMEAKEKKRAEEDCFEFLKDLMDVSPDKGACRSSP